MLHGMTPDTLGTPLSCSNSLRCGNLVSVREPRSNLQGACSGFAGSACNLQNTDRSHPLALLVRASKPVLAHPRGILSVMIQRCLGNSGEPRAASIENKLKALSEQQFEG